MRAAGRAVPRQSRSHGHARHRGRQRDDGAPILRRREPDRPDRRATRTDGRRSSASSATSSTTASIVHRGPSCSMSAWQQPMNGMPSIVVRTKSDERTRSSTPAPAGARGRRRAADFRRQRDRWTWSPGRYSCRASACWLLIGVRDHGAARGRGRHLRRRVSTPSPNARANSAFGWRSARCPATRFRMKAAQQHVARHGRRGVWTGCVGGDGARDSARTVPVRGQPR